MKSTADLPQKKTPWKRNKHENLSANRKNSKSNHTGSKTLVYTYKSNRKDWEITPNSSTDHLSKDSFSVREIGDVNSQDLYVCSMYITSYNSAEDKTNEKIIVEPFVEVLNSFATGKIKIQRTCCGIIVAFTKEEDADKVMKLPLQNILGGPVQVARFLTGEYKFKHNVVVKDIPWCISNLEIHQALKMQGIHIGKVIRTRTHVKIEILNALDMQRLVEEGLNFFNYTSFAVVPENNATQGESDIIQCFKCQGFWHTSTHCRQLPRCVRCGENHDVEYCPRPRSSPVCCHCGGPHHAAFKMCPVRLQHINSTYVGFQLAKYKPNKSIQYNMF